MLHCRDLIQLLYDYVERRLEPSVSRQLDQHLADCPACVAFVNTYKQTTHLSKELRCEEMPPELQRKLRSFLKTKLPSRCPNFWERIWSRLTRAS